MDDEEIIRALKDAGDSIDVPPALDLIRARTGLSTICPMCDGKRPACLLCDGTGTY